MIMQSAALVSANKHPTDDEIKQALAYNCAGAERTCASCAQ